MKKLIIVGNKKEPPKYNNQLIPIDIYKNAIDSFDFVCRINRMMNYDLTTGTKTDGLYLGGWKDFVEQYHGGEHKDIIRTIPTIFIYGWCWAGYFKNHWKEFITQEQKDNIIWCDFDLGKIRMNYQHPCSVISMIDYFCNTPIWYNNYEIYFTGIDVNNRGEILKNGEFWKNTLHAAGGDIEEAYIRKLMEEGKLKWLEQEIYKSL